MKAMSLKTLDSKIDSVRADLKKLDEKLDASVETLDTKIDTVRADLKTLDEKVNRVAAAAARTEGSVQDLRHEMKGLATKADSERVIQMIQASLHRSEDDHRAVLIHGASLTEQALKLSGHEKRISALENRL